MPNQMISVRTYSWLAVALVVTLSGCAGLRGLPREPGLYVVEGEDIQRLDGNQDLEPEAWKARSNFSPGVSFLMRDPWLVARERDLDRVIQLHRVGWVRSEITRHGEILPVNGSQWVDADIRELKVPVSLEKDVKNNDVIRVIPLEALKPGLYTLRAQFQPAPITTRIGVGWAAVDRRSYAAANCVDRYPGSSARYRPCAAQQQVVASALLKVHLVKPEIRDLPGHSRQLIVKGLVINTSDQTHRIPPLKAQLVTEQGVVVKRWAVDVDANELPPGASAPFDSRLSNPPVGANNVQVTFSSFDSRFDKAASDRR